MVVKALSDADDTTRAMICPKCQRIMLKFKFAADIDHGIDVSTRCEEVWLDEGEWHYLRVTHIHGDLPKIFTEPWQRRLREQRGRKVMEAE